MTRHDPFASINQTHICHGESQTKPKGYPSGPANAMQCDASLSVHRMWRIRRRIAGLARRAALRCHATHDVYPTIHVQRPASHPHRRARTDAVTHTVVARPWFGCMPPTTQSAIRWTAIDAPPLAFVRAAGRAHKRSMHVCTGGRHLIVQLD